jgi:hypothetical protein
VQPQRFLHLGQQVQRELGVVTIAATLLNPHTLLLYETLSFGDMSLGFQEILRDSPFLSVHENSPSEYTDAARHMPKLSSWVRRRFVAQCLLRSAMEKSMPNALLIAARPDA